MADEPNEVHHHHYHERTSNPLMASLEVLFSIAVLLFLGCCLYGCMVDK